MPALEIHPTMSHISEEHSFTNSSIAAPPSTVPPADDTNVSCGLCDNSGLQLKIFYGFILMIFVAASWIASTQFIQDSYSVQGFKAPFFIMYFIMASMTLFYPIYLFLAFIRSRETFSPREAFREHIRLYNPVEFAIGEFMWKSAMFCLLWSVTNYTFIRALDPQFLDATDVVTLFATNHSFAFLLSWIVLYEKFVALRICAMIFSLTGIILFAYADGFAQSPMWGVTLAVVSSATISITKVLYKKFVYIPSNGQISLFLSIIGVGNTITMWPILLTLTLTKVETLHAIPWQYVFGATILIIVLQVIVNYAEKYTFSMFIGLGFAFGIPLCAVSDYMWKNRQFHGMKVAAVVLTFCGLVMVLLPDKCPDGVCMSCPCRKRYVESPSNRTRHRLRKISRM